MGCSDDITDRIRGDDADPDEPAFVRYQHVSPGGFIDYVNEQLRAERQESARRHVEETEGYVTKDSGRRETFDGGARRDTQEGKPRYDLIPPEPLKRLAELYARGAEKYGEQNEINWIKGMPTSRIAASLYRHLEDARAGKTDEDHLAAVCWNAFAWMYFQGTEWDDLDKLWRRE